MTQARSLGYWIVDCFGLCEKNIVTKGLTGLLQLSSQLIGILMLNPLNWSP